MRTPLTAGHELHCPAMSDIWNPADAGSWQHIGADVAVGSMTENAYLSGAVEKRVRAVCLRREIMLCLRDSAHNIYSGKHTNNDTNNNNSYFHFIHPFITYFRLNI